MSPILSPDLVRDARLDALLRREIVDAGVASTAAIAWARFHGDWRAAFGEVGGEGVEGAIFDLASVTKPLTATVAARLVHEGRLAWSTAVHEVLPELSGTAAADATMEELLSHRAGVPAWGALYRRDPWGHGEPASLPPDEPLSLERMLEHAASRRTPSETSVYSDVGYVLAGSMIARVGGERLASAWLDVCGIGDAQRARARHAAFDVRVAPTEQSAWRGEVRGEVHDENAWALQRAGGDPGHAGAFATVDEVLAFAIAWTDAVAGRGGLVDTEIARAMIAPRAGGSHRVGWDGRSGSSPSSGARFGERTFGHLGFTGTSVWIDPEQGAVAVLLTNRTWPTRANVRIRGARPRVHDALWSIDL